MRSGCRSKRESAWCLQAVKSKSVQPRRASAPESPKNEQGQLPDARRNWRGDLPSGRRNDSPSLHEWSRLGGSGAHHHGSRVVKAEYSYSHSTVACVNTSSFIYILTWSLYSRPGEAWSALQTTAAA